MIEQDIKYSILEEKSENRQEVAVEPLERGFGHTLGNSLRRVMLSYLEGAGITKVKINDVPHEFSAIKGVHEDVVGLVQNLKKVRFKMSPQKVYIITVDFEGEQEIKAGDLKCPAGLEVVNEDQHIATLSDKRSTLSLQITVEFGRGYQMPEESKNNPVGTVLVDANFSPVRLVSYRVENTRVGRETELDRLVFDITTDGSMTPVEAIKKASAMLSKKFEFLAGEEIDVTEPGDEEEEEERTPVKNEPKVYLEELNLPTRVLNTLKNAEYETVSDLKGVPEDEIRKIKNIGPKTIDLLIEKINEYDD